MDLLDTLQVWVVLCLPLLLVVMVGAVFVYAVKDFVLDVRKRQDLRNALGVTQSDEAFADAIGLVRRPAMVEHVAFLRGLVAQQAKVDRHRIVSFMPVETYLRMTSDFDMSEMTMACEDHYEASFDEHGDFPWPGRVVFFKIEMSEGFGTVGEWVRAMHERFPEEIKRRLDAGPPDSP